MKIPKGWDEVTLGQFVQLQQLQDNLPEPDGTFLRVSILSGIDVDEIQRIRASEFADACKSLSFLGELPKGKTPNAVLGQSKREFNRMTVGEFIDLEERQGKDNLAFHLALMYPLKGEYDFDNSLQHAEAFEDVPMSEAYPALLEYQRWRKNQFDAYKGLFSSQEITEEKEIPNETPAQRRRRLMEQEAEEKKAAKWNWFSFLSRLANHDPLRYEDASRLNIIFALNHLSYLKENQIQPA